MVEEESLLLQSLQRGPVTPRLHLLGPTSLPAAGLLRPPRLQLLGPTSLPAAPRLARKALPVRQCRCRPPPAYPQHTVQFGVAND
ncbi:hypothetical protein RHMOL_Rhmol01G0355100 [Rhododendron molle]|uniref:Uncharacterized protein n=1 Tax=Rhododendron molle TaxID=49168 RepID=A0ACC0QAS4_RHOML|nr:hypothetical protein RHMOL_Rhmol01G0355100 [Rhododendron molle]